MISKEEAQIIDNTCSKICDKFCKFGNTGNDGQCIWCLTHNNECPLDELLDILKDHENNMAAVVNTKGREKTDDRKRNDC